MSAQRRQQVKRKAYLRSVVAILLILTWSIVALSGFLLYIAPHGPRSGHTTLLFLTKNQWGAVHWWISVLAMVVTVAHVAIDWRALKACLRYLTSVERSAVACK